MAPFPVPEAGDTVNQVALSLALQLKVPPPVLLMVTIWVVGLAPPCWAVKDRLVGLAPIAGLTELTGTEGGDSNCVKLGISAANRRIVRPPPPPLPEEEEVLPPAAASGVALVDGVLVGLALVLVVGVGATLMVAIGMVAPMLMLSGDVSLG